MLEKYGLERIFKHYKRKYNLTNLRLDLYDEGLSTHFKGSQNYILIGGAYIKKPINSGDIGKRIKYNITSEMIYYIFILLHELKHAIDYHTAPFNYTSEIQNIDSFRYETDREYHHKQSFERRADDFANAELSKWIKN